MWDIEVDVACVGAGIGTLAGAIATIDAGAKVLVATPALTLNAPQAPVAVRQRVGGFLGSWARTELDSETSAYFAALTEDLGPSRLNQDDRRLNVRAVRAIGAAGADDEVVAPFIGAKLRDWNEQCLTSPFGMLYSTVSGWTTKSVRSRDGESLEVQTIGTMSRAELVDGQSVNDWVLAKARDRSVDVRANSTLERIVFEDGRIVGVVLATANGPLRVGARRGVSISSYDSLVPDLTPLSQPRPDSEYQVCLVGQTASRFLRLELLETALPEAGTRPMCTLSGRHLRDAMRESRQPLSAAWRCGKLR